MSGFVQFSVNDRFGSLPITYITVMEPEHKDRLVAYVATLSLDALCSLSEYIQDLAKRLPVPIKEQEDAQFAMEAVLFTSEQRALIAEHFRIKSRTF